MPSTISRLKSTDSLSQWASKTNQLIDSVEGFLSSSGSISSGYSTNYIAAYSGSSWNGYLSGGDLTALISGASINFTITPAAITSKSAITTVDTANDYLLIYQNSSTLVKKIAAQYISHPDGSDTYVQYNNSGAFGSAAGFTFASGVLSIPTGLSVNTNNLYVAGGKVGIGNTSPTTVLDVTGNINTSTGYYIAGTNVINSTTLGVNILTSSLTTVGTLISLLVSTTLGVTGAATFSSSIQTASLSVTGAATVGTTLGVTGAATFSSSIQTASLSVTSAATVGTTLSVTGAATFTSNVTVSGVLKGNQNVVTAAVGNNTLVSNTVYNIGSTGVMTLPTPGSTGIYVGFRPQDSTIKNYSIAGSTGIMGVASPLVVDSAVPFDLVYTGLGWVLG